MVSRFAPWALAVGVFLIGVGAGCAPTRSYSSTPASLGASAGLYPLTVTDGQGRSLTLAGRPERIASLSAGHTEILFAVGAGPQVMAVDKFSDYPPEAQKRTQIDAFQPNLEALASLKPDLVLLTYDPGGIAEGLERLRIPAYVAKVPTSVEGVLEDIRLLGRLTGHPEEAERLAADLRTRIEAVRAKAQGKGPGPRVFHELDPSLFTASAKSFVGDLYTLLGAGNIASDAAQEYPQLTQEVVIQRDPEVIILADEGSGESPTSLKARRGWGSISAVRTGRVHVVNPDLVSRPGPRVVEALEALAVLLYPDLRPDIRQ